MTDHSPRTSKKEILPEGIYIEAKPVIGWIGKQIGTYHAYLVYRDGKGNAEVIRGGPETMAENEKAEGAKGVGAFAYSTVGGDIEIEAGIPLGKSLDAYKEGDNPQKRFAKRIVGGKISKPIWDDMVKTAQTIGKNETDYNLLSQKCNSIVATVLNRSGLNDRKIFHNLEERN